ncbi:MAG: protein kinase [Acidobacteriota bacterium]
MSANPFFHRSAITNPEHFFGRTQPLATLLARAGAEKPQCVSIVGPRRIGKSSLLQRLAIEQAREGDSPLLFLHHDLEASGSQSTEKFFGKLTSKLERLLRKRDMPIPEVTDAEDAEERFTELVELLTEEGCRVVFLLDEFDTVTLNPHFDADFFGRLRYLTNCHALAWVTASFVELTELCHSHDVRQSPFFNVFTTLHLGLLEQEEVEQLVLTESDRAGRRFDQGDLAIVKELAGRHPLHAQQAASAIWEHAGEGRVAVQRSFLEDAEPHFRHALAHLDRRQARTLVRTAKGRDDVDGQEIAWLERRALLVSEDGERRPFSSAFGQWLVHRAESAVAEDEPRPEAVTRSRAGGAPGRRGTGPAIGDVLGERYLLESNLGAGGFGEVFAARDRRLDREVAIKVILQVEEEKQATLRRERFFREARAAARIAHENIVAVHDVGEDGGLPYLVMERVSGRTLRRRLSDEGALPTAEALGLAGQAALGLSAAHALGVIHRDIKPENLLLDANGRLRIVDFGLAWLTSDSRLTADGSTVLTPPYASPEQVMERPLDGRSDLFSLGSTLWEMLVGRPAFDGGHAGAILYKIVNRTPPQAPSELEERGQAIMNLVLRCLARDPEDRPGSCAELAERLAELVAEG